MICIVKKLIYRKSIVVVSLPQGTVAAWLNSKMEPELANKPVMAKIIVVEKVGQASGVIIWNNS